MGFPAIFRSDAAVSGDFDSDAAGTVKAGTVIDMEQVEIGTVSCLFTVDAETDTITLEGSWQVSADNSTWYDCPPPNNPATVVLATGTTGADAAVSKVLPLPGSAYGWKYSRPVTISGVTTGAATDTYSMTNYYRQSNSF